MVNVKCLIPSMSRYAMYVAFDSYFSLCVVVCVCVCVLNQASFLSPNGNKKKTLLLASNCLLA